MFRVAAERKLPVYTHMRSFGRIEPGSAIEAVEEVIGAAAITGAPLHIVHINSTCLRDSLECISLVEGARARGLDVTTEAYPYIAGMTAINSAVFNPGWREKLGIDYSNLVIARHRRASHQRALRRVAQFQQAAMGADLRQHAGNRGCGHPQPAGHDRQRRSLEGHPRNAGTYSRVLAQYVREKKTLTLMEALRKMTSDARADAGAFHARRTPKGRLQEGADADIVVFDPQTISDRSTFEKPMEPSVGVHYLLVGGTPLIDEGKLVPDVFPGRALVGPGKRVATTSR